MKKQGKYRTPLNMFELPQAKVLKLCKAELLMFNIFHIEYSW